jgi:hypothetical protein
MSRVIPSFQAEECISGLAERRAWVRYPCDLDSSCRPAIAAQTSRWVAKVRNVSSGGIALALGRRFEPGALLTIDIQKARGDSRSSFLAKVVHVTREDAGSWLMGCAFRSPLSEEEIQALL